MTLLDFLTFLDSLDESDRLYIESRLQPIIQNMEISQVIKLSSLYSRLSSKYIDNIMEPLDWVTLKHDMQVWCENNCKGQYSAITVTNWAFQYSRDAMAFKLVWDRSSYDGYH